MPLELPVIKQLNCKSIILASASPRRKEILGDMVKTTTTTSIINK